MESKEYPLMFTLENSHWWFLGKRAFISTVFPKQKDVKVLDVGSGTGGTTKFLRKFGTVVGVEPDQTARQLAKKRGLKIIQGVADQLPVQNSSFQIVTIFDVLYHQGIDDLKALKEAFRTIKPNGYLIVTDCAFEFLRGPHDVAVNARERYTRKELVQKIEKAGFKIEKASYIFFFLFPIVAVKRILGKLNKNREASDLEEIPKILNQFLFLICSLEAFLLRFFNFPWGSSIIIRARKNRPTPLR